jgi:heavy metal translocating P-type ATPase
MNPKYAYRWVLATAMSGLVVGGVLYFAGYETAADVSFAAGALIPVLPLVGDLISKLRQGQAGVDVIALIAVVAALALGEFLTAAIIGLMVATGQALEEYAAGRAERELTALVARAPRVAYLVREEGIVEVDVAEVIRGDRLLIKAGGVIPVDGVVIDKSALIDVSALTGEPLPVERHRGDLVESGSVNAADVFEIQATTVADESTYAGIIRLVEQARESKAPSVRLADRWAGWFVPLTLGVAGIAWLVSGDPVRALAVLVVATPCPLLLAVPIAVVSGISRAARRGIIFRGGGALEALAQTRNILIDKTGTVTVGRPAVRSVTVFDHEIGEDEVLALAASVDQTSTHIMARAIVEEAHNRGLDLEVPQEASETVGDGVSARIGDRKVAVGQLKWLLNGRPEPAAVTAFRKRSHRIGPTAAYVSIDDEMAAAIIFDDRIRSDAAATIRALRRTGVDRIVMATGDHETMARSVGMAIGVDEVLAEVTPGEKVDALTSLQQLGVTTMVGDGINDAPALAAADVGVAMGARGATASSEAADVVLVVDRLRLLVDGIVIAQRSRRIAIESVVIGMGLSLVAMSFAAFGLIVPIAGAIIQEGIDVIAILNSLRALFGKSPGHAGPQLPKDLSHRLRLEHEQLVPRLDSIRDAADNLDEMTTPEAIEMLGRISTLLTDEILPHEIEDETVLYPQLSEILPGEDPMASMSRSHREIFHLVDAFNRETGNLSDGGGGETDLRDLRRILYGLHAILRLHFDQEEELYLSLEQSG